jgi:hypothetical protein
MCTMNRKRLTITLMVLLTVLLGVGGTMAEDPEPAGEVSITAAVSSRISYQGVLKDAGSPVTGSRDMTFRLYSDDGCTTQMGGDITKPGVSVADGLFTVELDVNHDDLNGQGLWLEVEVGVTAVVCQEILPVPYALSLRPGASIIGEEAGSPVLLVENSSTAHDSRAIRGYASAATGFTASVNGRTDSSSTGAKGVWGYAAGGGQTYGVHGESKSTPGRGVYGIATATSGETYGVVGKTASSTDGSRGVYGQATATSGAAHGVWGETGSNTDWASGVVGKATADSGFTHGVQGVSASDRGHGVYGWAPTTSGPAAGVYGQSDSPDGWGVYGLNTAGGYAGYFDGDVAQRRSDSGLVKAGVYTTCGPSAAIHRSFNNVTGTNAVSGGGGPGLCTIDLGFSICDRFWVATAVSTGGGFVTCLPHGGGAGCNGLDCYRFNREGVGESGYIMVLVY